MSEKAQENNIENRIDWPIQRIVDQGWGKLEQAEREYLIQQEYDVEHIGEFIDERVQKIRELLSRREDAQEDNPLEIAMFLFGQLWECRDWDPRKQQAIKQFLRDFLTETLDLKVLDQDDKDASLILISAFSSSGYNPDVDKSVGYWVDKISDPTKFIDKQIDDYSQTHEPQDRSALGFLSSLIDGFERVYKSWSYQKIEMFLISLNGYIDRIKNPENEKEIERIYPTLINYSAILRTVYGGPTDKEKLLTEKMYSVIESGE